MTTVTQQTTLDATAIRDRINTSGSLG